MSVEFEETNNYMDKIKPVHEQGILGFLIRYHIVKNKFWANILIALLSVILLSVSGFLIGRNIQKNQIIPYNQLPKSVQNKLPEPVRKAYDKDNNL